MDGLYRQTGKYGELYSKYLLGVWFCNVLPDTGIVWNNRGYSFSLDQHQVNYLKPGMKPRHTLNPAFADLNDGRSFVYGTMGGEGQPQTQSAIINRVFYQQQQLQQAIDQGRWLLGKTWGDDSNDFKTRIRSVCQYWGNFAADGTPGY